jgi:hypothetical protein
MSATVIRMTPPGQHPEATSPDKLIVLCAFDRDEAGVFHAAFEPREMPDERRAIAIARMLSHTHVGVIAWSRDANVSAGEYGPPKVLYRAGEVPDLD